MAKGLLPYIVNPAPSMRKRPKTRRNKMAKRRMSAKARAAALRNLAKARRARGNPRRRRSYRRNPKRRSSRVVIVNARRHRRRSHYRGNPLRLPSLGAQGNMAVQALMGLAAFSVAAGVAVYVTRQAEAHVSVLNSNQIANLAGKALIVAAVVWASKKVLRDEKLRYAVILGAASPLALDLVSMVSPQAAAYLPSAGGPFAMSAPSAPAAAKQQALLAQLQAELRGSGAETDESFETGTF